MFVLAVTAGGVRRKNVAGAQARQARGPDHIPIELWGVLIVSPPVVVFADEIRMVELPSHFFRQRSGGGVSVGGADGTLGRRQEFRRTGHGQVSSYTPISTGFSLRKSKMASA